MIGKPIFIVNKDVDWAWLSMNPNAIHLLEKNLDKVSWEYLSSNPNAIHILEKNLDKISWNWLSANPNAIHIIEENLDKVSWFSLSSNPNAIHLLEKNLDKVFMYNLSENSNAIHLLATLDTQKMKENMKEFKKELICYLRKKMYQLLKKIYRNKRFKHTQYTAYCITEYLY